MNKQSLPIIRLALLSGVVVFAIVAFTMSPDLGVEGSEDLAGVLRLAFAVLAIFSLLAMRFIRAKVPTASANQAVSFTIAGWALGEATALFGAIILLLTGLMWPVLLGVGIMLLAFLMFPIP